MLISLLGFVGFLTTYDPAKLSDDIQTIHQTILAPDEQRNISRKNLPLLRPTLLEYIQEGQAICQCKFEQQCIQTHVTQAQQTAKTFQRIMYNIRPALLTNTQQVEYDAIKKIVPEVTRMPMLCVKAQQPILKIKNYYPQPRLDFFLKELRIATKNICGCGNNEVCQRKTKTILGAIYQNIDTSKLTNNYTKAMWLTYDALSNLCLGIPREENNEITIPDSLLIADTVVKQPTLTLEQAREYVGFDVSITRKDGREQTGILMAINNNVLTLAVRLRSGTVDNYVPIQSVARITATKPKEEI